MPTATGDSCESCGFYQQELCNSEDFYKSIGVPIGTKSLSVHKDFCCVHYSRIPSSTNRDIIDLMELWNRHSTRQHRPSAILINLCKNGIEKKRRLGYSLDDIKMAVENYFKVLRDPASWFKYEWRLPDFLNRENSVVFMPQEFNAANYSGNRVDAVKERCNEKVMSLIRRHANSTEDEDGEEHAAEQGLL